VILALHDRNSASQDEESGNLLSLFSSMMSNGKIPAALLVEIPLQTEPITVEVLQQIMSQLNAKYRTIADRNHTIILGNKQAGLLAYELFPESSGHINSCLLFDANLPEDATATDSYLGYYLDISDEGINYKGYHSLYMSLRKNNVDHEYRVRQGTSSHESFLNGVFEAAGFIKEHLRN